MFGPAVPIVKQPIHPHAGLEKNFPVTIWNRVQHENHNSGGLMNTVPENSGKPISDVPTVAIGVDTPSSQQADSATGTSARRCVALVDGPTPHLTAETEQLLRVRLRMAAGLLFLGFAAFLVQNVFHVDLSAPVDVWGVILHTTVTLALAALAAVLWMWRKADLGVLRLCELAIFGLPTIMFLYAQYWVALECCKRGYFEFPEGLWLVLIYTYALFIPNTFRRAVVVIGLMAAAPVITLWAVIALHPQIAKVADLQDLTGIPLLLAIAAVGSIYGARTIGLLREQAFEGRQLGQYRLKRCLGAGGMGEVYLAEHQLLKRPCVIKLILPERAGDPRTLARFRREVQAAARLSHWNNIAVYDYGHTESGTFYYVMEYLPGMNLAELVARFGPLSPARTVYLLRQVCDALTEAHSIGLIHRDIKPGNIFLTQRGRVYDVVKLLDFGLVKPVLETDGQAVHLTAEGTITGTPLFMSPEQATGQRSADVRSDLYSVGVVAYFLLCGRPPFEGDRPMQVIVAHASRPVMPPSSHRPDIPGDLEQVILRCLEKDPADRYPSAQALGEALGRCEVAAQWTQDHARRWWQEHQAAFPQLCEPCNQQ